MKEKFMGVHIEHCCILHGCKYGAVDCPVESGEVGQKYICDYCYDAGIKSIDVLNDVVFGKQATCPHCGHIV